MSSTNRGYKRHISDFYITPEEPIIKAFTKLKDLEFIHSKRPSFFPEPFIFTNEKGKEKEYKPSDTDSCEYAHFAWQKGHKPDFCKTFVI